MKNIKNSLITLMKKVIRSQNQMEEICTNVHTVMVIPNQIIV